MSEKLVELRCISCDDRGTVSILLVDDVPICFNMELPWRDNKPNISCFKKGGYDLKLEWSPHFERDLYEIYGTEGRTECKFHIANWMKRIKGCCAPGSYLGVGEDGFFYTVDSTKAFNRFMKAMDGCKEAKLIVTGDRP